MTKKDEDKMENRRNNKKGKMNSIIMKAVVKSLHFFFS